MQLDGRNVYVAVYSYTNNTWSALENVINGGGVEVPGPATAIAIDDADAGSVFISGISASDNSTPYLLRWDGLSFTVPPAASSLGSTTSGDSTLR